MAWSLLVGFALSFAANAATLAVCGLTIGAGCLAASLLIHTAAGALTGLAEGIDDGASGNKLWERVGSGAVVGLFSGSLGFVARFATQSRLGLKLFYKKNFLTGKYKLASVADEVSRSTSRGVRFANSLYKLHRDRKKYKQTITDAIEWVRNLGR
jgi:hypothetical protein